jgi:hypothetical protein
MLSVAIESHRRRKRRRRINAGDFRGKGETCNGFGDLLRLHVLVPVKLTAGPSNPAWWGENPPQLEHSFIASRVRLRRSAEIVGIGKGVPVGLKLFGKAGKYTMAMLASTYLSSGGKSHK